MVATMGYTDDVDGDINESRYKTRGREMVNSKD